MQNFGSCAFWRPELGSRTARGLILFLCLATWRGPIPVVHAHGSEDVADAQLERHLLSYHQGHLSQRFFAWHMHLLLPWERFDSNDCSQSDQPVHDPLTHEGVVLVAPVTAVLITSLADAHARASFCDQQIMQALWDREWATTQAHVPAFHSFFESLLLGAPLCAVTGVALC